MLSLPSWLEFSLDDFSLILVSLDGLVFGFGELFGDFPDGGLHFDDITFVEVMVLNVMI